MSTVTPPAPPPLSGAEFDALMVRLYPLMGLGEIKERHRSKIAAIVAERLWLDQALENEDTALFRAHLRHLHWKGYFAFTDYNEFAGGKRR